MITINLNQRTSYTSLSIPKTPQYVLLVFILQINFYTYHEFITMGLKDEVMCLFTTAILNENFIVKVEDENYLIDLVQIFPAIKLT